MLFEGTETSVGDEEGEERPPAFGVSGQFMMTSEEKSIHTDDFNPRKIVALTLDDSLARLFECLTLEYSGSILLSPKWKNFRSQKLKFAEKTRINNAIWRSWHIQFQMGQRPLFCQFDNPLTEMAKPPKPMTLMVEGRYWKRKLEVVAAEYQKWRVFYKQMVEDKFQDVELQHQTEEILRLDQEISNNLRVREKERKYSTSIPDNTAIPNNSSPVSLVVSQAFKVVDSCNLMESMVFSLPDTLFTSLEVDNNKKTGFSNTRMTTDTSDIIQPTLDTLQPSLEAMTPVLDDLIEQLEASMKGSELNWDFGALEKNFDEPMNLIQSSSGQEQFETMDHSGGYTEQYEPITSQFLPSSATPWRAQTSVVNTLSGFPDSQILGKRPVGPVLSQASEMPGLYSRSNRSNVKLFPENTTSVIDLTGPPGTSSITSSDPTSVVGKPCSAATARMRYSSPGGSIPRNSSDSQLYALSTAAHCSGSRARSSTTVPVEVQVPNLVAQLKMTKSRHPLMEEKVKRPRIPRNKSAPGLASLEASAQLKKAPQTGGVRAKKLGRIPRNRSDSSLTSLLSQCEQTSGRQRRGSESFTSLSEDNSLTRSAPSVVPPSPQRASSPQRLTKHRLSCPGEVESMQQDIVPQSTTATPLSSSALATMSGSEGGESSQLVSEMVAQLVNKGISIEEILGKLNTMVQGGSLPQVSQAALQTTFANIATNRHQAPQASQNMPFIKGESTSSLPITSTSTTPTTITQVDQPMVVQQRNRRKNQTPRVNPRAVQPERTAVTTDTGLRSTDDIIQSLLSQSSSQSVLTRPEMQSKVVAATQLTTIDPSSIRAVPTTGSATRWGGPGTTTSINNYLSGISRTLVSPITSDKQVSVPGVFQVSSGSEVVFPSNVGEQGQQFLGVRSSPFANTSFTSSMVLNTSPVMTVTQVTTSARTSGPSNPEGATTSLGFSSGYQMNAEPGVRGRPLTKTLPKEQYIEHRRMVHVSAEQKRRGNIKMGFDQLVVMVPSLASQNSSKISKAAVLKKTVDYISEVQRGREQMELERERLEKEIEALHGEISVCQEQLPETGVMVNKPSVDQLELLFNRHIKLKTQQNPKFWIFSTIYRPLFDAYSSTVTTGNTEEFFRTVLSWLNQNCSLPKLRPSVLTSLRELIKRTSILTDPSKLPVEARQAANALDHSNPAEGRPT